MSVKELEERVATLEREVQRLRGDLSAHQSPRKKDWRRAVAKHAGDEGLLSIFAGAQKLREKDREQARKRRATKRKARS